jgi:hypothetical protein
MSQDLLAKHPALQKVQDCVLRAGLSAGPLRVSTRRIVPRTIVIGGHICPVFSTKFAQGKSVLVRVTPYVTEEPPEALVFCLTLAPDVPASRGICFVPSKLYFEHYPSGQAYIPVDHNGIKMGQGRLAWIEFCGEDGARLCFGSITKT